MLFLARSSIARATTLVAFGASMTDDGTGFYPAFRQAISKTLMQTQPAEVAEARADALVSRGQALEAR